MFQCFGKIENNKSKAIETTTTVTQLYTPDQLPDVNYDIQKLREKINIKVIKTGKYFDNLPDNKFPMYSTRSENRGRLLLISNIKPINKEVLVEGAEFDKISIAELFSQMGFAVKSHEDLTRKKMKKKIKAFCKDSKLKRVDIGAVIIMSHSKGEEKSDSSVVACADGKRLDTSWIINQFSYKKCPNLSKKPKIFIFQCCTDDKVGIQFDGVPVPRISSDVLIGYSMIPGFISQRDPTTGTWYIQTICRIFMDHAHDTDVESLLKMVDNALSQLKLGNYKVTSFENRGFKTCYLHP